jgi:hypothetical protein
MYFIDVWTHNKCGRCIETDFIKKTSKKTLKNIVCFCLKDHLKKINFATAKMVVVAQLVRASVCGTEGRRFEPGLPPKI